MSIAQKKYVGIALGAAVALLVAAPALFGFTHNTYAADVDQYFKGGNNAATASGFANNSGLKGGDLIDTVKHVIQTALGFLGIIAVVIIMLGGFKWMTSGGDPTKTKDAKNLIFAGIVGLIIVLSAYAIATFVINQIVAVQVPA